MYENDCSQSAAQAPAYATASAAPAYSTLSVNRLGVNRFGPSLPPVGDTEMCMGTGNTNWAQLALVAAVVYFLTKS